MNPNNNPPEKIAARPFSLTREFAAPRELVWKAWTEAESLRQWFGPKGFTGTILKLDLRPGGTLHSCLRSPDGTEMWGKWVFREVKPQELLVWVHSFSDQDGGVTRHPLSPTWPLELLTETTFEERGDNTVVTLKWTPLNATDEEIRTFNHAHQGMTHGWGGTFDQLTGYLTKTKEQQMSTTATNKENHLKLQLTRVFDAPRELVFQAWTEAKHFRQWFGAAACDGGTLQSVKVDARIGGKYRLQVRRADGEYYTTVGTYREVRPPERLVFTWAFEKDGGGDEYGETEPPETLVTLEFKALGGRTELTLTHERFVSAESRDRHEDGWTRCLASLGEFVGQ